MYRKIIKYTDYNGNEQEEPFYFNLTKEEILKWELETSGGMENLMKRIIEEKDRYRLIKLFVDAISRSYGVKSDDGKRFIKNEKVLEDFKCCPAYSELFMELASDANAATEFMNGIIPADLLEEAKKIQDAQNAGNGVPVVGSVN